MIKIICLVCLINLVGCAQMLPELFKSVEQIADDDAIKLQVSREAIQKETDVTISVSVTNKDQPKL